MHTIAIYFDKANRVYVFCSDGQERCRSDTRIRHFSSPEKTCSANKRRIRESDLRLLVFNAVNKGRLKKCFRRPLCAMRMMTLCFDKANRTYVGGSDGQERCRSDTRIRHFLSSEKIVLRTSVGFENLTYAYCIVSLWAWKIK